MLPPQALPPRLGGAWMMVVSASLKASGARRTGERWGFQETGACYGIQPLCVLGAGHASCVHVCVAERPPMLYDDNHLSSS